MADSKARIIELKNYLETKIIGQEELVRKLIITLLADGHALVEGAPGLAKTKAIKTLAECITSRYNRIQFTPDLLPSDITGSEIYVAAKGEFEFRKGPIFANLILADEINRAPAKVQSALLEAMAERQVSVGGKKYLLPELFMVMATQNPIEHEGTYNLPEAQLDRFLMFIKIDQPDAESEKKILQLVRGEVAKAPAAKFNPLTVEDILAARQAVLNVHMSEAAGQVLYGASPRATIALDRCAKINAWIDGRDFVTPEDIHAVIYDILRHRIILSFEAQAEGVTADGIISSLLRIVPLP